MTWRRLGVLIRHLPAGSETHRVLDADHAAWGLQEHLLAAVVDLLMQANWQRRVTSFKGPHPDPPEPIERPGVAPRKKAEEVIRGEAMSVEEMRRRLGLRPPASVS